MRFCFALYFLSLMHVQAELSGSGVLRVYADLALQVSAGGSVIVTLTLIDSRRSSSWLMNAKEEYDFYITSLPQQGRLSAVQQFSRKSNSDQAQVIYTHLAGNNVATVDSFAFEARERKGPHRLAGTAKISILKPQLKVEPLEEMDFGNVMAGERATRQIQIKNLSEVKIFGDLKVDAPFSVANSFYEVLPYSEKRVELICYSPKPGFYQTKLKLSSHPDLLYSIRANFLTPLIFVPEQVDFGTQVRKMGPLGKIELYNRSKHSQHVRLHIPFPFQMMPEVLTLPGQSKRLITLRADEKVEGRFSETMLATSDRTTTSAKIQLNWLSEPKLEIINNLDFGKTLETTTNFFLLINRTLLPWQGQAFISKPFYLRDTNLIVKAGETQALSVTFNPPFAAKFEEELILTEKERGAVQRFLVKAESVRSFQSHSFASNQNRVRLPLVKPQTPQAPKLSLLGMFYTMLNAEVVVIKWKSLNTASSYRLYQKRWQWNGEKTRVIEEWSEVEDVSCQAFDKNMIGFRVDRLRPNWSYTFAIYEVNSEDQVAAISDEINVATPSIRSSSLFSFSWFWGGLTLLFIPILWWLWKRFRR